MRKEVRGAAWAGAAGLVLAAAGAALPAIAALIWSAALVLLLIAGGTLGYFFVLVPMHARGRLGEALIGACGLCLAGFVAAALWPRTAESGLAQPRGADDGARVTVTSVSVPVAADGKLHLRVSVRNGGPLAILRRRAAVNFVISRKLLTESQETAIFDALYRSAATLPSPEQRLAPGGTSLAQDADAFPANLYQGFEKGDEILYVAALFLYSDARLDPGKEYVTEYCAVYLRSLANPRGCAGHNRDLIAARAALKRAPG